MTTPDGGARHPVWQYGYDGDGNRTSVTDPLQHVTASKYDGRNRLTQVTDFLNHTTKYAFDGNSNQTSVTDGNRTDLRRQEWLDCGLHFRTGRASFLGQRSRPLHRLSSRAPRLQPNSPLRPQRQPIGSISV